MVTLFSKWFIKDRENVKNAKVREAYGTLCSFVGIFLNILLFAGKYLVGMITGSIAIMADAFNNLSDAGSSVITLVGFLFAGKKADPEHPFGHGRVEYITGFAVSVLIMLMGFELGKTSIDKIFHPKEVTVSFVAILVLVGSILVKVYMYIYNSRIGKKIDSAAMKATAMDSMSDSVATSVVLLAMAVLKITGVNLDGISGVFVALFILYAGFGAAKETLSPLLGRAPSKEFVNQIEGIVMAHEEIKGIHDLVVHDYGPGRIMISLHAEVNGDGDIYVLHDVIDCAESELNEQLHCESVIHMDPIEVNNEKVMSMRMRLAQDVKKINPVLTIHDFRMVDGPTHTNLIFDVVVPADYEKEEKELIMEIQKMIDTYDGTFFGVIRVDKAYA